MISTALRVANEVCLTRLRCRAAIMALGVDETRIADFDMADVCGLNVDGHHVVTIIPTWESTSESDVIYEGSGEVTIDVLWSPMWAALKHGAMS